MRDETATRNASRDGGKDCGAVEALSPEHACGFGLRAVPSSGSLRCPTVASRTRADSRDDGKAHRIRYGSFILDDDKRARKKNNYRPV